MLQWVPYSIKPAPFDIALAKKNFYSKMQKERRKLEEARDAARNELDEIAESLKDAELSKKDRTAMEERQRELLNDLAMFDTDDD